MSSVIDKKRRALIDRNERDISLLGAGAASRTSPGLRWVRSSRRENQSAIDQNPRDHDGRGGGKKAPGSDEITGPETNRRRGRI